jgi:hypothetical protein
VERAPNVSIPTVVELDQAIDLLGELLHRYMLLTTGADLEIMPTVLFNWAGVFDQPWRTAAPVQGEAG